MKTVTFGDTIPDWIVLGLVQLGNPNIFRHAAGMLNQCLVTSLEKGIEKWVYRVGTMHRNTETKMFYSLPAAAV